MSQLALMACHMAATMSLHPEPEMCAVKVVVWVGQDGSGLLPSLAVVSHPLPQTATFCPLPQHEYIRGLIHRQLARYHRSQQETSRERLQVVLAAASHVPTTARSLCVARIGDPSSPLHPLPSPSQSPPTPTPC